MMLPELSHRLAKIASKLHEILDMDSYKELTDAAEAAGTFDKLDDWFKFLILYAEGEANNA